ncbi:MAG: MFS transporter [Erysipelotrichaceae bacterium]|nr:MFS transporter [Erysipelotrichaceae bacterium]
MKNRFIILYFLSYFCCAVGTTQMIPYLMRLGYDGMQKGILLSSIAISTIFLQFLFGYLSDKTHRIKAFFIGLYSLYLGLNVILFQWQMDSFIYYLVFVCLVGGCYRTTQGLLDTWLLQSDRTLFSKARAFGALGWAIGSWLVAFLLQKIGFSLIVLVLLVVGGISFILSFFLKDSKREKSMIHFRDLKEILRNHQYLLFVFIVFLLYALGTADMYIVVDKLLSVGGSEFHVGMKWGMQSLMELPILLVGDKLLKKFAIWKLMMFASLMFLARFLVYAWVQSPMWFLFASIFQLITFPLVVICSKEKFEQLSEEKWKSTGQMFAMSIYMGFSLFLMPLVCSGLVSWMGYDGALIAVSSLAIFAMILLWIYHKKYEC